MTEIEFVPHRTEPPQLKSHRYDLVFVVVKFDPRTRRLTLDNFILVSVNIKRLTDSFRTRDREMRGQAVMQYEDFVGLALGAHK